MPNRSRCTDELATLYAWKDALNPERADSGLGLLWERAGQWLALGEPTQAVKPIGLSCRFALARVRMRDRLDRICMTFAFATIRPRREAWREDTERNCRASN